MKKEAEKEEQCQQISKLEQQLEEAHRDKKGRGRFAGCWWLSLRGVCSALYNAHNLHSPLLLSHQFGSYEVLGLEACSHPLYPTIVPLWVLVR